MTWNAWGNLCKWKSLLCVCVHDCMHMHVRLGTGLLCVWALGSEQIPAFRWKWEPPSDFPAVPSASTAWPLTKKRLLYTQTHVQTFRHAGKCTWRSHWKWIGVFLCRQVSSEWSARSQMQPLIIERTSVGDGEKLHTSSWKLDDCSMCSCLTGDP